MDLNKNIDTSIELAEGISDDIIKDAIKQLDDIRDSLVSGDTKSAAFAVSRLTKLVHEADKFGHQAQQMRNLQRNLIEEI